MAAVGRQPRLLVLRALGVGDLLTGVPALRALADGFPNHRRTLACPQELAPLVLLTGAVDAVADASGPVRPRVDAAPEVAVDLHGRGPESHRALLELAPRRLIAFACPAAGVERGPAWAEDEHEVHRWCRLLGESGIPADRSRIDLDPPPIRVPEPLRGLTIVHPGAAAGARRWPQERFAAVARAQVAEGRRVVLTGGRRERELAAEVARLAGLPSGAVLAGRTGLRDLAALVAAAERVVCGDTGMAHLATAFRTPSVVLFGPVSPERWGPPPDRPWHRALWAGRRGDPHAAAVDPGLLSIGVDDVLDALAGLPAADAQDAVGAASPG
ncbi:MAG TPA: glycosyltransferase family 9 protein [Thermoleophilaceae bacterium]|nr:glycosyltransferase family 9 protein [Thermoleophilaceae bacterium]